MGLYGDNTATKRPQSFRTPQNNHQMVSPGQQGGFEVTRAASKGGFHVIHDLGGGGGEGGWEAIFQHLRDILSDLDHSTCRELVTGNTDDLLPKISPEFRSNEVQSASNGAHAQLGCTATRTENPSMWSSKRFRCQTSAH